MGRSDNYFEIRSDEDAEFKRTIVDMEIKSVVDNGDNITVKIKRNPGEGDVTGMKFAVSNGIETQIFEKKNINLDELEEREFILDYTSVVKEVSIFPIFTTESGKEITGEGIDSFKTGFIGLDALIEYGLVSWWRMNGDAEDEMGLNDGINNGADCDSQGMFEQACEFNGESGYIDMGNDSSLDFANEFSVSVWVKNVGNNTHGWAGGGRWDTVVSKWDCTNICEVGSWWLGINPQGQAHEVIINSSGNYAGFGIDGTTYIKNDSTWHHIAASYDGSYARLFLDGRMEFEKPYSGGIHVNSSVHLRIAASKHTLPNNFNGTIDEVMVFNKGLTKQQMKELYNLKLG